MSNKGITFFWIWVFLVLLIGFFYTYPSLVGGGTYEGNEVKFVAHSNMLIRINTTAPITMRATSSKYFLLRREPETVFFGVPETHPSGFYGEKNVKEGVWKITEGSGITLSLTGEKPFGVRYYPNGYQQAVSVLVTIMVSIFLFIIGISLWAVFTGEI